MRCNVMHLVQVEDVAEKRRILVWPRGHADADGKLTKSPREGVSGGGKALSAGWATSHVRCLGLDVWRHASGRPAHEGRPRVQSA